MSKKEEKTGGPNRHERRAAVAHARLWPAISRKFKAQREHELQRRQREAGIENRIMKAQAKKAMRIKMANVGQGISQTHLERRAPKATAPKK